jgi:hypothetical protein
VAGAKRRSRLSEGGDGDRSEISEAKVYLAQN